MKKIMLQGTGSDVGKSLMLAGLARALHRRGMNIRPFKPQNMSNNAAATIEGGEIGRAQALQARASYMPPSQYMNPILLKPEPGGRAQIIVLGQRDTTLSAAAYQSYKAQLWHRLQSAWATWCEPITLGGILYPAPDMMLVEGAGSASEVNLRENDLANMGFALATQTPVILVADIDRGGVIASIIGTWHVLPPPERALLKGYIINKFRGDPSLFTAATHRIMAETGLPCLGIVPWFDAASQLPAEDSLGLAKYGTRLNHDQSPDKIRIAVPHLPHIANFDDLDPLMAENGVELALIPPGEVIPATTDLVIIPGSKATLADLAALRAYGFDIDILAHVRRGGFVLGLCGGYQMLGQNIRDPDGIEGKAGDQSHGLGLLAVDTIMKPVKQVGMRHGFALGESVHGYEIHLGETVHLGMGGADCVAPFLHSDNADGGAPFIEAAADRGAVSPNGGIMGCYLHGIFANDGFRQKFLQQIRGDFSTDLNYQQQIDAILDKLAQHLESSLNIDQIISIA